LRDDLEPLGFICKTDRQPSNEHATFAAATRPNRNGCTQLESVATFAAPAEQIAESSRDGGDQQVIDGAAAGMRGGSKVSDRISQDRQMPPASDRTSE